MRDKVIVVAQYYSKGNVLGSYEENVSDLVQGKILLKVSV